MKIFSMPRVFTTLCFMDRSCSGPAIGGALIPFRHHTFAAPQWLVRGAGAFRLAARVALQWAVRESAVLFGRVRWESDLFWEAV